MTATEMKAARMFPHHRTRAQYMQLAREARRAVRSDERLNYGMIRFYHPVDYYVRQARRANRMIVQDKVWASMR